MPISLPPPPKSRGVVGLVVAVAFVIWTGYLMTTYSEKKPATATKVAPAEGPIFMDIDLRGPQYDLGHYEGYQKGLENKAKGFTLPAENVLSYAATASAEVKALSQTDAVEYSSGFQSGFKKAMTKP